MQPCCFDRARPFCSGISGRAFSFYQRANLMYCLTCYEKIVQKSSEQNGRARSKQAGGCMKGPVLLSLSLTVNFGLLGWFGLQLNTAPSPPRVRRQSGSPDLSPAGPHTRAAGASAPVRPPEFRWSRIESEDYPTYITSLRTIGCPEKTIRDIILAMWRSCTSRVSRRRASKTTDDFGTRRNNAKKRARIEPAGSAS